MFRKTSALIWAINTNLNQVISDSATLENGSLHRSIFTEPSGAEPCHPAGQVILSSLYWQNNEIGEAKGRRCVFKGKQQLVQQYEHCTFHTSNHQMSSLLSFFSSVSAFHLSWTWPNANCFHTAPETQHQEAVLIVAGDFNSANLKHSGPNLYQHITCTTRGERTPGSLLHLI